MSSSFVQYYNVFISLLSALTDERLSLTSASAFLRTMLSAEDFFNAQQ